MFLNFLIRPDGRRRESGRQPNRVNPDRLIPIPADMSDYGDDDFMCDEDEDYDLQYSEVISVTPDFWLEDSLDISTFWFPGLQLWAGRGFGEPVLQLQGVERGWPQGRSGIIPG